MPTKSNATTQRTIRRKSVLRRFSHELLERELRAWKSAAPKRRFHMITTEIGVARQTLVNWRNGTTCPDGNELLALGYALDVSLDRLSAPVVDRQ